jgi:hypothetical protein
MKYLTLLDYDTLKVTGRNIATIRRGKGNRNSKREEEINAGIAEED